MRIEEVLPKDAIPSVDEPAFDSTHFGEPDDRVLVLEGDVPRAYPLRILSYHEIVNDVVEGTAVAVTWCPLCGSAIVYERTVDDRVLSFGVSGKLADDDLVMYDRETESEWKQSLGTCIAGELEGAELDVLPAAVTEWATFREEHPDGVVLQPPGTESETASDDDEPAPVDYAVDPYEEYAEGDGFGLAAHRGTGEDRSWDREDFNPKTVVLGIERGGDAVGYPRPALEAAGGVVTDTVSDLAVVIFAAEELHAFENPGYDFRPADGEGEFIGDGTVWDATTGRGKDGRELDRVPSRRLYAFAWQDDHGPEAFYSPSEPDGSGSTTGTSG